MPFLAFYKQNLAELFNIRSGYLVEYLRDYSEKDISNFGENEKQFILNKCTIKIPVINPSQIEIEKATVYTNGVKSEEQTTQSQSYQMGDSRALNNAIYFKIPFSGEESVFYLKPYPEFPGVIGLDEVTSRHIVVRFISDPFKSPESQIPDFLPQVRKILTNVQSVIQNIQSDIDNFNLKLKLYLESEIARRQHITDKRTSISVPKPTQINSNSVKFLGSVDLS